MTERYQKVKEKRLTKLLLDTVRQALRVIKRDEDTREWASQLSPADIKLDKPFFDEETSRHLSDDRDVYIIEGTNDGYPALFRVDFVHEESGDRRGHCVDVDIWTSGHHLDVSVYLPLPGPGEDGCNRPFVNVQSITNL